MKIYGFIICGLLAFACKPSIPATDITTQEMPDIYPDYKNVTIPPNIAPLNFAPAKHSVQDGRAILTAGAESWSVSLTSDGFCFPEKQWKNFLKTNKGKDISCSLLLLENNKWVEYAPFQIHIAQEEIDSHLVYRLIPPGYENWNEMGIYERDLSSFQETAILENRMTDNNCMNCHSFCNQNPRKMLFHMRGKNAGTYLLKDGNWEKLNTKTPQTISALVYPSWNPDGRFVAFSVNETFQAFHRNDRNRIEVYDTASDVVVYDTEKHEIVSSPLLKSAQYFETFPTFSADGKSLYFCTAQAKDRTEFDKIRYNLCRIAFDPETRQFGAVVDTLFQAEKEQKSVSFPRVSPDGRYLMFTVSGYGNFSIWHKDADLYLLDLEQNTYRPLSEVNSDDVESYHSWSSNGRWFVFSSRREDGLYTRPYFAYMATDGKIGKPFLLPQKEKSYYKDFMYSYNIPELVTGSVGNQGYRISRIAKQQAGKDVKFSR